MKNLALVLVVILLAALLFERVSSRREEAHRRQGELQLVGVKQICGYAARGEAAEASVGAASGE